MKCMEEIAGHKEESSDSKVQDKNNYQDELNGDDLPKAIDSSSNLYNHIITNYTPPKNDGEYKCPKCYKGFHKKNLLRKHKINCKPKMQKDLLTRYHCVHFFWLLLLTKEQFLENSLLCKHLSKILCLF